MTTLPILGAGPRTSPRTVPDGTRSWELAPDALVRIAGLPTDVLTGLRVEELLRWAERVLDAEDRLAADASALSDRLAGVVGATTDAVRRRELVGLRRDVFNLRPPTGVEGLDASLAQDLGRWDEDRRALAALRETGEGLASEEAAAVHERLVRILDEPRLRAGLLLASPALEAQLDAWARGCLPARRARKVERAVVSYVTRAAAKPSPFSTLTGVAVGHLGVDDPPVAEIPETWTSRVRLSVAALTRIAEAVLADPGRRRDLPVALASGWEREPDRVRYVRRSLRVGDATGAVTLDAARGQLFFLRRSDILEDLLTVLDRAAPLHRDLSAWLAGRLDASPADGAHYVDTLLDLGMLQVPPLAVDVHADDPLRDLRDVVADLGRPWATALAADLDGPLTALAEYAAADPARRRALLTEVRTGLGRALAGLDVDPGHLPATLVYEDAHVGTRPLAVGGGWAADVAGPLRTLDAVLPAFDPTRRHRETLLGFFLARHGEGGRCEDVLRLVHDFHEDLDDEYAAWHARTPRIDAEGRIVRDPDWLGLPAIARLDDVRDEVVDRLTALVAARPDAEELDVTEVLETASAGLDPDTGFTARTHFLQRADTASGGPLVVHNGVFGGFAFPFSRFTHGLGAGQVERLRERARRVTPAGAVLAEVTGGAATTNLNLHTRLTDHVVVGPGEATSAAPRARIGLDDLHLVHDPAERRLVLRSHRLGREVVPVYLGYLVPQALPAVSRTLLLLSPAATLWFDPWAGVPEAAGPVAHRPRLRLGPLVVARRSWTAAAAGLPGPGTGPAAELLAWQRWRRVHGLPGVVFAVVHPESPAGPRPKPAYLDLSSPLCLSALRAGLTPGSRVTFTEPLPDPGAGSSSTVTSPAGPHVAELAVETVTRERTLP